MGRRLTAATSLIKEKAAELGFDVCRIGPSTLDTATQERFDRFIELDRHGSMAWMKDRAAQRRAPTGLWPEVQSVIAVGMNYGPETDPLDDLSHRNRGVISVYARNEDYHDVLKKRLKQLGRWMAETLGGDLKVFVDTAPVLEKPLAAQAGVGWQGKHTNLVSRDFGAWLFLGVIYSALELPADSPEVDHCGSCQSCLDICPTAAFPAPYQLDARRCISYLTIEHKGPVPAEFRKAMGNRIYGCDDCLAVCPWNKFAQAGREAKLTARDDLNTPTLASLAELDDTAFRALFRKSPVKRIGRDRFIRNVMIAIGNSEDPRLLHALEARLVDASADVRAMAAWAWRELGGSDEVLLARLSAETDEHVRAELTI